MDKDDLFTVSPVIEKSRDRLLLVLHPPHPPDLSRSSFSSVVTILDQQHLDINFEEPYSNEEEPCNNEEESDYGEESQ